MMLAPFPILKKPSDALITTIPGVAIAPKTRMPGMGIKETVTEFIRNALNDAYPRKIGIMYGSQRLAMSLEIEPIVFDPCETCRKERPHSFWPAGEYRCIFCLHHERSVLPVSCEGCGMKALACGRDGLFRCYFCWANANGFRYRPKRPGRPELVRAV